MDMGRVHGGGGGVRAGRAERAGMHWGPLKSSDRGNVHGGKGCVGGGSHVGSWGHELEPRWPWNGAGGAGGGGGESGHGKSVWGDEPCGIMGP